MCTSITVSSPFCLHGRNLDLEYSFGEQVVITPRGYEFRFHCRPSLPRHLAMIGMANVANEYPLYAEAVNEAGLYMAGLNFPGNAFYPPREEVTGEAVTPYELIPLVLGQCETLAQARELLASVQLVGIPFASVTCAIFAGLVFPLMLSCLLRLRMELFGPVLVFLPLVISFGSDTFALFAGMLCGRHKLAPKVSPKKTVEGAIGGLIGGVIGMTLFKLIADSIVLSVDVYPPIEMAAGPQFSWAAVFVLGIIGSAISQIGDLSFSVIKREFGVKDYGKLLPGHGGILDRFDSVTFVSPCVWLLLTMWILR